MKEIAHKTFTQKLLQNSFQFMKQIQRAVRNTGIIIRTKTLEKLFSVQFLSYSIDVDYASLPCRPLIKPKILKVEDTFYHYFTYLSRVEMFLFQNIVNDFILLFVQQKNLIGNLILTLSRFDQHYIKMLYKTTKHLLVRRKINYWSLS